jgi:hypothetical protein
VIISSATPPAALPPSVAGGGSAPVRNGHADSFAGLISRISGDAAASDETSSANRPASASRRSHGDEEAAAATTASDPVQDPNAQVAALTSMWWNVPNSPIPDAAPAGSQTGTAADSGGASEAGGGMTAGTNPGAGASRSGSAGPAATVGVPTIANPNDALSIDPHLANEAPPTFGSTLAAVMTADETDPLSPSTTGAGSRVSSSADQQPSNAGIGASIESTGQGISVPNAKTPVPAARGAQADKKALRAGQDVSASASGADAVRDMVAALADGKSKAGKAGSSDAGGAMKRPIDQTKIADRGQTAATMRGVETPAADLLQSALTEASRAQSAAKGNTAEQDSAASTPEPDARTKDTDATLVHVSAAAFAGALHADHDASQTAAQAAVVTQTASLDKTTSSGGTSGVAADRMAVSDENGLHRQMVQAIRLQSRNGVGDARITLQPEYLGEVSIALRVEDGAVTAHVSAASAQVREWLGANESMLRQGLLDQGLKLDRLVVTDEASNAPRDSRDKDARRQQEQEPQEEPRSRPRRSPSTTFEITV